VKREQEERQQGRDLQHAIVVHDGLRLSGGRTALLVVGRVERRGLTGCA